MGVIGIIFYLFLCLLMNRLMIYHPLDGHLSDERPVARFDFCYGGGFLMPGLLYGVPVALINAV